MKKELAQKLRRANVSVTAREVMQDLLYDVSVQKPFVFVDVNALVASVGRKKSTIRRALRELVAAGFLSWDGTIVSLKHKIYKVVFDAVEQAKRTMEKVTNAVKKVVKAIVPNARREVEHTLRDFGFAESERNEVISVNGVEKTQQLILDYLESLRAGETMEVKKWFIMRYVQERQAETIHR